MPRWYLTLMICTGWLTACSDPPSAPDSTPDGDVDSDFDSHAGDGDADVDADPDADSDGDHDFDDDLDGDFGCPGHPEMSLVRALGICIDRYEASEGPGGQARSVPEVLPWAFVSWETAGGACAAAGKRLCTPEEWQAACRGPEDNRFPYGPYYDEWICNGQDRQEGRVLPTGSLPDCEGGYPGVYDMSANLWEWVDHCTGDTCQAKGGSFYDIFGTLLHCDSLRERSGTEEVANVGFRCCLDF